MRQAGGETENRFERHVGLVETLTVACVGCGAKPLGRVTALKSCRDFWPGWRGPLTRASLMRYEQNT